MNDIQLDKVLASVFHKDNAELILDSASFGLTVYGSTAAALTCVTIGSAIWTFIVVWFYISIGTRILKYIILKVLY